MHFSVIPNQPIRRCQLSLAIAAGLMLVFVGCNQQRYQPAEWKAAPRANSNPSDKDAMADNKSDPEKFGQLTPWLDPNVAPGGATYRDWQSGAAGSGTTMPLRNGTTMPLRNGMTLPMYNETTLPMRNGITLPERESLPGNSYDGTTLPRR